MSELVLLAVVLVDDSDRDVFGLLFGQEEPQGTGLPMGELSKMSQGRQRSGLGAVRRQEPGFVRIQLEMADSPLSYSLDALNRGETMGVMGGSMIDRYLYFAAGMRLQNYRITSCRKFAKNPRQGNKTSVPSPRNQNIDSLGVLSGVAEDLLDAVFEKCLRFFCEVTWSSR